MILIFSALTHLFVLESEAPQPQESHRSEGVRRVSDNLALLSARNGKLSEL